MSPPEQGSGKRLGSGVEMGSRTSVSLSTLVAHPLRKLKISQSGGGGPEGTSHGEASTKAVPREVTRGGGAGLTKERHYRSL